MLTKLHNHVGSSCMIQSSVSANTRFPRWLLAVAYLMYSWIPFSMTAHNKWHAGWVRIRSLTSVERTSKGDSGVNVLIFVCSLIATSFLLPYRIRHAGEFPAASRKEWASVLYPIHRPSSIPHYYLYAFSYTLSLIASSHLIVAPLDIALLSVWDEALRCFCGGPACLTAARSLPPVGFLAARPSLSSRRLRRPHRTPVR